jgi:hypothetical protein
MNNHPAFDTAAAPKAAAPTPRSRLRPLDLEALRRLRDHGPLTIPQAYDCGHSLHESKGHGMNRLVAACFAVFHEWDAARDDALWSITSKGKKELLKCKVHHS